MKGAALAFLLCLATTAYAGSPSGVFRYTVGDVLVTALDDGTLALPITAMAPPERVAPIAARDPAIKDGKAVISVNAFLLQMAGHNVLIDAGSGTCTGLIQGKVADDLHAAGVPPDKIDMVLVTHLHFDHVCGLITRDRQRAYPNATVWVAKQEVGYWLDEKIAASQPEDQRGGFLAAHISLAPYEAAKKVHYFEGETEILSGLKALPAPGHTPGHTAYLLASGKQSLLFWGDIIHFPTVQFQGPDITIGSDVDKEAARSTRMRLFEQVANRDTLIAGAHLPFPGIGHLRKDSTGYAFLPVP